MKKTSRLKILFIAGWYPTKENPVNGIFVKEHARAVSLYNDVVVLHAKIADFSVKGLYEISDEVEDGIRTVRVRSRKSLIPRTSYFIYLWIIFVTFRKLLKEGFKPDIIHAHVFEAGVSAVIVGKIYKIPMIVTEHSSAFPRHKLGLFGELRARFAMNRAKIILPVSKNLERVIKSYRIKNKFEVVPNVVDTKIFYPSLQQNRNDKKRILLVALLTPIKGVPYLLKAIVKITEKRQDFVLDIVGDGLNRKEYEGLAKNLELDEVVKFQGLKTKKEVAEFMRNCDFFVQPSLCETFGVTCAEVMACGKSIVATRLPVLQEKINEDIGILVPPKDTDALANAIDYMLDHYQDYSPEKISRYAKDNFSYEVVGKKLDDIYKRMRRLL